MKNLVTILLILSTGFSYASELVRMKDGLNAVCAEKYDILNSKANNIFNLENPNVSIKENHIEVKIEINFFECVEVGGIFGFQKLEEHMSATYSYPDLDNGGYIHATRMDKEKNILAINDQFSMIGQSEILKENNQFYVKLILEKADLEVNHFPQAQDKGGFYTTLMLRSLTKVVTPNIDLGYGYVSSGAYRLFLDLE